MKPPSDHGRFTTDDRAVSIAVTHVLTLGISAILITGLMLGAGALIDGEKERGAQHSLETIGERLSGELSSVDRVAANDSANSAGNVTLRVDHPRTVSGSTYSIELTDDCSGPLVNKTETCLILTPQSEDVEVQVPVTTNASVDPDASAHGGPITITYDGTEISMESGH